MSEEEAWVVQGWEEDGGQYGVLGTPEQKCRGCWFFQDGEQQTQYWLCERCYAHQGQLVKSSWVSHEDLGRDWVRQGT